MAARRIERRDLAPLEFCARRLPEADASRSGREPDQPGIPDRRLPVLDRVAIDRIANHLDEGRNARIRAMKHRSQRSSGGPISMSSNLPRQMIAPPRRMNTGPLSRP